MSEERKHLSTPPLRIAVQGTGNWGRNLVRVCRNLPGAELAWIVDPDPNALAAAAALAPNAKTAGHIDETDFAFDATIAATPAIAHVAHVEALIKRGIHVLCEKPAALLSSDAERIVREAERRSLCLAAGHQMVFHPAFEKLRALVEDGTIGTIRDIDSVRTGPMDFTKEPGVIWSYGPHDISMIGELIGFDIIVSSRRLTLNRDNIATRADLAMVHKDGTTVRIRLDGTASQKQRIFTVHGDRGALIFDDTVPGGRLNLRRDGHDENVPIAETPDALNRECAHFTDCIRRGALPRTGGAHLIQVTRILADNENRPKNPET